jgi:amidophosphoribosyltransferase
VKNAYVGRTFIQPSQTIRQLGIRLKLNPLREVVKGKRLVVVDDSIVRGNTQRALVRMLREAGAAEVHVRISSPPVMWPCFYGIDFASRAELIASGLGVEEIRASIGADSLAFVSLDGLTAALRAAGVHPVPRLLRRRLPDRDPAARPHRQARAGGAGPHRRHRPRGRPRQQPGRCRPG